MCSQCLGDNPDPLEIMFTLYYGIVIQFTLYYGIVIQSRNNIKLNQSQTLSFSDYAICEWSLRGLEGDLGMVKIKKCSQFYCILNWYVENTENNKTFTNFN